MQERTGLVLKLDYGRRRGATFVYRASLDRLLCSVTCVALGDFQNSNACSLGGPLSIFGPLSVLELQDPLILEFLLYRLGVRALILGAETLVLMVYTVYVLSNLFLVIMLCLCVPSRKVLQECKPCGLLLDYIIEHLLLLLLDKGSFFSP